MFLGLDSVAWAIVVVVLVFVAVRTVNDPRETQEPYSPRQRITAAVLGVFMLASLGNAVWIGYGFGPITPAGIALAVWTVATFIALQIRAGALR